MKLTEHARVRLQQRAIPPLVLDLLLQFGARDHAPDHAQFVYFDKRSRRRMANYAGCLAPTLDAHLDVCAVVGNEEQVITTGHRTTRIRRS
jgi:hypothetical protein